MIVFLTQHCSGMLCRYVTICPHFDPNLEVSNTEVIAFHVQDMIMQYNTVVNSSLDHLIKSTTATMLMLLTIVSLGLLLSRTKDV